jgi:DNA polymerase
MINREGRLQGLFQYYGAERTGRFAGKGSQPQNLFSGGPDIVYCRKCGLFSVNTGPTCQMCSVGVGEDVEKREWCIEAAEQALEDINTSNLDGIEKRWGDPTTLMAGCLRALFVAGPGKELLSSDYHAIEAVVLAVLADEKWRIEVFKTHGKIYEACLNRITGIPLEEILNYKKLHGTHHPLRKKLGKIPELASGYQGWINAWKQFGADKYMTDEEIKDAILKWRADSPNIAGVTRYREVLYYGIWQGLEQAARSAISNPGHWYHFRNIAYIVRYDVLYCLLPSGRYLCYHSPEVDVYGQISYMGWNSNYLKGPVGWMRLDAYGGSLTENVVQAVSRDILVNGMFNIEYEGKYPIVLHVHDEIVSEVPIGYGSIEHFEQLMSRMPEWARDWPVKASGGWRGYRYRKD